MIVAVARYSSKELCADCDQSDRLDRVQPCIMQA